MHIFKPIPLVKNLPIHIECLSTQNDCLVITTKQGHLMKYRFSSKRDVPISADRDLEIKLELVDSCKQFSKKPVSQIKIVPELKIIITLSDGSIHVNDYDNLSVVHQIIQKTKGASCFATNLQTQKTLTGEVQYMLRMCVVVKKKLILLYWKNKNFHEMSIEIDLKDQPRTISWCSESLFVGYKSEYDLIKLTCGMTESEVKNLSATGGRQPEPIIKILQDEKISINRDENTYILDQNGDPHLKYSITWSDIPIDLAEDYPYLIAILPSSIVEVRTIEPHLFIQRLEFAQLTSNFSKIRLLTNCPGFKGLMIAASANDIIAIVALPLEQQKVQMISEKHFELALKLANMQPDQDPQDAGRRDIELQYAHDLFRKGSYKKASELFYKLDISPLIVIDLFPDLSDKVFTQETIDERAGTVNGIQQETEERIAALIEYLIQIRRKIYSSSKSTLTNSTHPTHRGSIDIQADDGYTLFSHMKSPRAIEKLKQEVDTTLLKCYLKTTDALVASLLRLPDNHCKLQVTEKALEKYKKYNELIILYQSRGLHRRALELLKNHFQDSPISSYEKTVQYLQHLSQDQLEIICEYAQWVLQNDSELGLKIFTADLPEAEQLDRNLVLEFLHHNAPQMEIPYLEHIIHFWNDKDSGFHTTLCLRYRQKVAPLLAKYLESIGNQVPCPAGQEPGELGELRRKLLDFLEISDNYSINHLPDLLQSEGLCEERAIVLGKIGQHEEALSIFVYVLNNSKRAEEYCLSVYQKKLPNSQDIFLLLLKTYIHGPNNLSSTELRRKMSISGTSQSTSERFLDEDIQLKILNLLHDHADKIEPLKAISELPDEFNLISLRDYLDKTFKHKLREGHEREMFRQLVMAKFYQVQRSWIGIQKSNKIVIDETTICQVCNKKMGNSSFVRFPNLDLVHYRCKDRYGRVVKATLPSFSNQVVKYERNSISVNVLFMLHPKREIKFTHRLLVPMHSPTQSNRSRTKIWDFQQASCSISEPERKQGACLNSSSAHQDQEQFQERSSAEPKRYHWAGSRSACEFITFKGGTTLQHHTQSGLEDSVKTMAVPTDEDRARYGSVRKASYGDFKEKMAARDAFHTVNLNEKKKDTGTNKDEKDVDTCKQQLDATSLSPPIGKTELAQPNNNDALTSKAPFPFAGIIGTMTSSAFFSIGILCVKLLPDSDNLQEKTKAVMWRGVFFAVMSAVTMICRGTSFKVDKDEYWLMFWRSFIGFFGSLGGFTAIQFVTMGEATSLIYLSIVWTAILGYFVLKEPLPLTLIFAIPMGMFGIIMIAHPDLILGESVVKGEVITELARHNHHIMINKSLGAQSNRSSRIEADLLLPQALDMSSNLSFDTTPLADDLSIPDFGTKLYFDKRWPGIIIATATSFVFAIVMIILKYRKSTPIQTCTFYLGVGNTLMAAAIQYFIGFGRWPNTYDEWLILIVMGACSWFGQALLQWSLQYEKSSILGIVRTVELVLAFCWSTIILDEDILWTSIVGATIILVIVVILVLNDQIEQIFCSSCKK